MDFTCIKSELYNFIDKLYEEIKVELRECINIREINDLLDGEYTNLTDYKKVLKFNAISQVKEEIINKTYAEDAIKKAVEIQDKICDIIIPRIIIDENEVYTKEDNTPDLNEEEIRENKSAKNIIVILGILAGTACGAIVKGGVLDAIIMGLIGALAGYSIYEITLGKNNNNFEKVLRKDREINRRLDREYVNRLIDERKALVENIFLDYISKFDNSVKELNR